MLKSCILTAAAAALLIPAAASAQSSHAGHDHSKHQQQPYHGPLTAAPVIEHTFTEAPDDHVIGAHDAPTTIIAYVSVTCGHCSKWFDEQWPTFKQEQIETGNVRFILREYPTYPANLAMTGFIIASCAPEDKYFENIEYQMKSQKSILDMAMAGKAREAYNPVGAHAGMKTEEEIIACFDKKDGDERIKRAAMRAQAAQVTGVPSFFIDGQVFTEEASAANLGAAIAQKAQGGVSTPALAASKPIK